jgi:membrane-associated phospholipid phosphatase
LFAVVLLGGAYVHFEPNHNIVDRLGFAVIPDQWSQPFWQHVDNLGTPLAAAVGALVSAAWVFGRDRRRAVTCLVTPLAAVILCENVIKPLAGRQLSGNYDYPSGHVTAASAMLAVLVLATPGRWRWVTGCLSAGLAALVAVAVVASRVHYPSDAVAGLLLTPAVLLLVDGVNRPGFFAALASGGRAHSELEETPSPPGALVAGEGFDVGTEPAVQVDDLRGRTREQRLDDGSVARGHDGEVHPG